MGFFAKLSTIILLVAVSLGIYLRRDEQAAKYVQSKYDDLLNIVQSSISSWSSSTQDSPGGGAPAASSTPSVGKTKGKCLPTGQILLTPQELKRFDGSGESLGLYLAFLGRVYDVSKGAHHYKPGGGYGFFSGRDASRAFITGDFTEEGLIDDLNGLDVDEFDGVKSWMEFYQSDYPEIGRLIGRYFDGEGCETDAYKWVLKQIQASQSKKKEREEEEQLFPGCNSEWSAQTNSGRVWCTKKSGGVERDWAGVPRKLYTPGKKSYRCVCVKDYGAPSVPVIEYADEGEGDENDDKTQGTRRDDVGDLNNPRLKQYENCDPSASECKISD